MPPISTRPGSRFDNCVRYILAEQKIQAIKEFREMTGAVLKDAKDAVDRVWPITTQLGYATATDRLKDIEAGVMREIAAVESSIPDAPGVDPSLTQIAWALTQMVELQQETNQLLKDIVEALSE